MFEGQPQEEVEALMQHPEFKQLFNRHKQLDRQVLDAELGVLAVDDVTLSQMKREKLAAKDRLTRLYEVLHHCTWHTRAPVAFLVGRRRPWDVMADNPLPCP